MADTPVNLTGGLSETVLPPAVGNLDSRLAVAEANASKQAIASLAASDPKFLGAWAALGDLVAEDEPVQAYAYYRVGYHRGLDTLRANGWRGSGYVRWQHPTNRGFLRSLDGLRRMAAEFGESEEAERCDQFLHQLDPEWDRREV